MTVLTVTIAPAQKKNRQFWFRFSKTFHFVWYDYTGGSVFFTDSLKKLSPPVMFDTFPVFRFLQCIAIMSMVALLALTGCRTLLPQSSTLSPPLSPPVAPEPPPPKMEESERYSAFRPIMPGEFTPPPVLPAPIQAVPIQGKSEPPRIEPPQDTAALAKIEELNQRIAELETLLTEARNAPPLVVADDMPLPVEKTIVKPAIPLPIINKPGVHVYADELQKVRIEIMDKSLFMSNTWQLSAEGEETLRSIAAEIRAADSEAMLDIEGHTDSLMSDPHNPMQKHDISSTKAMAVMKFFIDALGWDAARIGTSSFGRSRPIADNGTPEGRARNNRIEIVVQRDAE